MIIILLLLMLFYMFTVNLFIIMDYISTIAQKGMAFGQVVGCEFSPFLVGAPSSLGVFL